MARQRVQSLPEDTATGEETERDSSPEEQVEDDRLETVPEGIERGADQGAMQEGQGLMQLRVSARPGESTTVLEPAIVGEE